MIYISQFLMKTFARGRSSILCRSQAVRNRIRAGSKRSQARTGPDVRYKRSRIATAAIRQGNVDVDDSMMVAAAAAEASVSQANLQQLPRKTLQ